MSSRDVIGRLNDEHGDEIKVYSHADGVRLEIRWLIQPELQYWIRFDGESDWSIISSDEELIIEPSNYDRIFEIIGLDFENREVPDSPQNPDMKEHFCTTIGLIKVRSGKVTVFSTIEL